MAKIGIIRDNIRLEEIAFKEEAPKLIFGLNSIPSQKRERKSIGHALAETGLEVYATDKNWPRDAYLSNSGLFIAERDFGKLAHGGYYIFGDGFVLVSSSIQEDLEKKIKDSGHFRGLFEESKPIFVPPYSGKLILVDGSELEPWHLDLTIGYVPSARLLTVDEKQFAQEEEIFEKLKKEFDVKVKTTTGYGFPNNYFAFRDGDNVFVIANRANSPFNKGEEFKVIETSIPILNIAKNGGSVRCAVNIAPTTKLWDLLGIAYRRWGVNPKEASYVRR